MAREHARIQTDIWIDDDFLDLTGPAQHLYFVLTTQMTLSFCGVLNWHPGRISQLAAGWTIEAVEEAASELSDARYIVIDETTGEALVRSFIRNDGLLTSPNISKAMYRTFSEIGSRNLRGVVVFELNRLNIEQPNLKGWEVCGELLGKRAIDPASLTPFKSAGNPSTKGSEPFRSEQANPSHAPFSLLPSPNSTTPDSPPRSSYPDHFERVWALYPNKRDKKAAYKAYVKASKEVSPERIEEGVLAYRDDPTREQKFTKHFSTWLNAGAWEDEILPPQPELTTSERRIKTNLERGQQWQPTVIPEDVFSRKAIGA